MRHLLFLAAISCCYNAVAGIDIDSNLELNATQTGIDYDWLRLGSKILSEHEDGSGYSVASSDDGNVIAIGSPFYGEDLPDGKAGTQGRVRILQFDDERQDYIQMGETLYGNAVLDYFGLAIDLSKDGLVVVIGSPQALNKKGQVSVFSYREEKWVETGVLTGEVEGEHFGTSVKITDDAHTIVVGAPKLANSPGKVRVFAYREYDDDWSRMGAELHGISSRDHAGESVDILRDEGHVFVAYGMPFALNGRGLARVYKYNIDSGVFQQYGPDVVGHAHGSEMGTSVSLATTGSKIILGTGSPATGGGSHKFGGVQVYSIRKDYPVEFEDFGDEMIGKEEYDMTGAVHALTRDGTTLAIGSPGFTRYFGEVRVYHKNNEAHSYSRIGTDIIGEEKNDEFGYSIALSQDGSTLVIGSSFNNFVNVYKFGSTNGPMEEGAAQRTYAFEKISIGFFVIGIAGLVIFVAVKRIKLRGGAFTAIPMSTMTYARGGNVNAYENTPIPFNGSRDDLSPDSDDSDSDDEEGTYEEHLAEII